MLFEIPATVGYLQNNFELANNIYKLLSSKIFCKSRLIGLIDKFRLLNRVILSPENSDLKEMIDLTKMLMSKNYEFVNLWFHSPSLTAGFSEFVVSKKDELEFIDKIRRYFDFISRNNIDSIKLCDAPLYLDNLNSKYIA